MTKPATTAAVILCGGRSSRMGSQKALLSYKGMRLVDYVAKTLESVGIENIFVSGDVSGYACLPDAVSGFLGPMVGIATAIHTLGESFTRLLFVPVDMPYLQPNVLEILLNENNIHAACFEDEPLPCFVTINEITRTYAQRLIGGIEHLEKSTSVEAFLSTLGAKKLAAPPAIKAALRNTNTPKQWQEALHEHSHD